MKSRFAPSPTGLIHFGNVRTALFNALLSLKEKGKFLLRIEDTDAARSREEYIVALEEDLKWLGLDWQEGEGAGGDFGPYRQSQRSPVYRQYLSELEKKGSVYPCFCSAVELEVSRKVQAASGQPPRYSGKCAHLKPAEVEAKMHLPHTLRFRMPKNSTVAFTDIVRGAQKFPTDEIGDFIIRRSDGTYAFFYVNALDDALMQVTHVLRGEDHFTNTPRQIALLEALGLPIPEYGHISLIVDSRGAPLSKRSGSLSVQELREMGYFPLAVNNYLARLGHHYPDNSYLELQQLADAFELPNLGRAPARYDRSQLDYWQAEALARTADDELLSWLSDAVKNAVPGEKLLQFAQAVRGNILFPTDALPWAEAIFSPQLRMAEDALKVLEETDPQLFRLAANLLDENLCWKTLCDQVKEAGGFSGKKLFQPLRAALTGQLHGPEMPKILPLIGLATARHRLLQHVLNEDIA